jgi:hypothetical protein
MSDKDKKAVLKITTFPNGVVAKSHNKRHGILKRDGAEGYEVAFRRVLTKEEQENAEEVVQSMAVTQVLKGKVSQVCVFLTREALETLHITTGHMLKIEYEKEMREQLETKDEEE